jgi:hypothetical protein
MIRELIALAACLAVGDGCTTPMRGRTDQIAIDQIAVVGQPVMVWDDTGIWGGIDASSRAWRERDGTVNLLINSLDAYRMRGPDLDHLVFDPTRTFMSGPYELPEDNYNFWHFLNSPYSRDGVTFYSLTHSEWYAAMLTGDLIFDPNTHTFPVATPVDNPYPRNVLYNSWTTTVNLMQSVNGGASWALRTVDGNHSPAKTSYHWTGTDALANRAFLHAALYSGLQQISRLVKEVTNGVTYYYAVGNHYKRDFSLINPGAGQWAAPLVKNGLAMIRTSDISNPNGWEVWTGGSSWASPITSENVGTFLPMLNGVPAAWVPNPYEFPGPAWNADIIFDTEAELYILIFTNGTPSSSGPVCYMTSQSLAAPVWSDYRPIIGTDTVVVGATTGFGGPNYVSMIDPNSPGFNFEYTNGNPRLYYVTGRKLYQLQLQTTYGGIPQTGRYLPGAEEGNRVCAARADEASRPPVGDALVGLVVQHSQYERWKASYEPCMADRGFPPGAPVREKVAR